ncbi:MAG TPA: ornithine cyclodeaminase family protein [Steroidobacteraceae bacterium]|nr:ornithine cyclodeaminase family protein [Steroidobacteraceae bacterium]
MNPPEVLLLSRSAVASLATTRDYLDAMQTAFADLARGRFEVPPVAHVAGAGGMFHIKSAQRTGSPSFAAIKVNGNFPENAARRKLPTIQGFVALLDAECGCVLALMDSIEITARRTAAATALAAQHLARADSRTLAMIGCGVQARYHVEALLDVRRIESVAFCDPRDDAAAGFAARMRELGLQARRVDDARNAVRDADIVVTVTTSTRPVLGLADIAAGAFVAGVGADNPSKHELAADLLKASRVIVDSMAQASVMGDLHHALEAGVMQPANVRGELADLVTGRVTGRRHDDERWVFDSTGLSIEDLAAATMLYERARAAGGVPQFALAN